MKWKLVSVSKETDHPFLNFYVRHYEVEKKMESIFMITTFHLAAKRMNY